MIHIKSEKDIELMREACKIVAEALEILKENIKEGITTYELDKIAEKYIISKGAIPVFKGYPNQNGIPFPASICTSINNEVIHGIPDKNRILKSGDIISVDCGVQKNGFHGDAARTFAVGNISSKAKKIISIAERCFFEGIDKAIVGNRIGDISNAIYNCAKSNGFEVIKEFQGHGIGKRLHEDPDIPNYGEKSRGPRLESRYDFSNRTYD